MIYQIDPLADRRWDSLVARHPDSSIFHTAGWLQALRRTYGYEPVVYTRSAPQGELADGLVFCRVSSWLTGNRLVSLPFSDHCDPLVKNVSGGSGLFEEICQQPGSRQWRYLEVRPRNEVKSQCLDLPVVKRYCSHTLDLRPSEAALFSGFHKDCTQRKVQRAEREKLGYRKGLSSALLKMFYHLFVRMRRKRRVPPQPFRWFQNLTECLGPAMQVRVALCGERPAASIVTMQHGNTLLYKYGCSDENHRYLGGIQWLFWKTIQEAKALGMVALDLGRSDWDNPGLIKFKDRLGGQRFFLNYRQYPKAKADFPLYDKRKGPAAWLVEHTPLPIFIMAGRLLYRHFG